MAKFCINCNFYKRVPFQQGNQAGMVAICAHPDFASPIDGSPLPVQMVRDHQDLCTFRGKGFIAKIEEAKPINEPLPKQGRLILPE